MELKIITRQDISPFHTQSTVSYCCLGRLGAIKSGEYDKLLVGRTVDLLVALPECTDIVIEYQNVVTNLSHISRCFHHGSTTVPGTVFMPLHSRLTRTNTSNKHDLLGKLAATWT